MIALAGLIQPPEVVIKFLLGEPRRAIDALQHRPVLIAAPVSARDAHQLERSDVTGVLYVRPTTEIKKGILPIDLHFLIKKPAAEEDAHRVLGVRAVANDIEVGLPGFAERTDADLAAAVLNALRWDAAIPAGKVDVTVSQGWVWNCAAPSGATSWRRTWRPSFQARSKE